MCYKKLRFDEAEGDLHRWTILMAVLCSEWLFWHFNSSLGCWVSGMEMRDELEGYYLWAQVYVPVCLEVREAFNMLISYG